MDRVYWVSRCGRVIGLRVVWTIMCCWICWCCDVWNAVAWCGMWNVRGCCRGSRKCCMMFWSWSGRIGTKSPSGMNSKWYRSWLGWMIWRVFS